MRGFRVSVLCFAVVERKLCDTTINGTGSSRSRRTGITSSDRTPEAGLCIVQVWGGGGGQGWVQAGVRAALIRVTVGGLCGEPAVCPAQGDPSSWWLRSLTPGLLGSSTQSTKCLIRARHCHRHSGCGGELKPVCVTVMLAKEKAQYTRNKQMCVCVHTYI